MGGLYLDSGLEAVRTWLHALLRPFIQEAYRVIRIHHGLPPDPPPLAVVTNGTSLAHGPPSRSVPSVGHLSLFNQCIQQKGLTVEWSYDDSEGECLLTTPIWVVRAVVSGKCLGRGRGSTKKAAKNEASKEGLQALGVYVP